jgi:DnaJ-class molecular chaperone
MNNPYHILGVNQDADKKEIQKAKMLAMRDKKFSLTEIANAERQLLDPSKRLAADFMYPTKIVAKRPRKIEINIPIPEVNLDDIDENALNSLT